MATDLIDRAQAGDEQAFRELVEPYQHELEVHCYRILGSAQDAQDAMQETLLAAWRGLGGFEQRSSLRTWLYRIATTRSLNALRSASRRPPMDWPSPDVDPPEPTRLGEVSWLEPYPDVLLAELPDDAPGPQRGQVGLNHMAWRVESLDDLKDFYHRIKDKNVPIDRVADHGVSLGIYFHDPDGNGIEVYYELPRAEWPRQEQIFAGDMMNRGRFPGPWDAELATQRAAAE